MQNPKKGRATRVRNRIVIFALTAIIMGASTYAWFIGMRTVNVSSFEVKIASTDSLLLSLDGIKWNPTIDISSTSYNPVDYSTNTNSWGGENGLIPMSSVGAMDSGASRMKLFEKASLTATPGGYRLLASRVNNYDTGKPEQPGYVAFDLFIKNFSGTQYYTDLKQADEEAIYLTTDSNVKVADTVGVEGTGIENSVRVAFAQIGRVIGTNNNSGTIQAITCGNTADVTGICRTAQIWEPNDIDHVAAAISWYHNSCLMRKAPVDPDTYNDVTDKNSYDSVTHCTDIEDQKAYATYAVNSDISSGDNINIYDGDIYNGYKADIYDETTNPTGKLQSFPYFTNTMRDYAGVARPTFMTLAPNSITKVRVYIYIEGQDVDNYDFAQIGKTIAVNFGFTKERYTPTDINYNGPAIDPSEF